MIFIDENQYISEGKTRKCYSHPNDKNLCIKIMKPLHVEGQVLKKEIKYHNKIQRKNKKYSLTFFAKYHGKIETNLGVGYLYDLIRDQSGKVSLPIKHYIETRSINKFPNNLAKAALKDIMQKMVKYKVFGYDVYHNNLLCRLKGKNKIELVLVDGIGINSKSTSIKSYFSFLVNYSNFIARKRVETVFRVSGLLDALEKDSEKLKENL